MGRGRWGWISHRERCCSFQGFLLNSSSLRLCNSLANSSSLASCGTLADLLLVSWPTVTLPANRGGRRGKSRAWVAKADVEGHVDTASSGGEVEGGIPTSGPNIQKLCQGSLDEVVVGHLKQECQWEHGAILTGKSDITEVEEGGNDTDSFRLEMELSQNTSFLGGRQN